MSNIQSAFIQGRQIMNRILIANKCVDAQKEAREKGVVRKLDLEKGI